MTGKTADQGHRLLRSYLIVGFFALLGIGEIILVVTGAQKLDDVKSWIALAGAIIIVGLIAVVLVGRMIDFAVAKWRGPTRTLSGSLFEINLDGFDSRYEELLEYIDRIPETGRRADMERKGSLREIAISLKEIKDKLMQMSGTFPYKEDLRELETQLYRQSWELLDISRSSGTLWSRFKSRGTGFRKDFEKACIETSELETLLMKNLEYAKKGKKARVIRVLVL